MRLVSIVEFPAKSTVSGKREGVERDVLKAGGEGGLQGNPQRAIGTDWHEDGGDVEVRSSSIVDGRQ